MSSDDNYHHNHNHYSNHNEEDLSNDLAIAQALAKEEELLVDPATMAEIMNATGARQSGRRNNNNNNNRGYGHGQQQTCPSGHELNEFWATPAQRIICNACQRRLHPEERAFSCIQCDYDICGPCTNRTNNNVTSSRNSGNGGSSSLLPSSLYPGQRSAAPLGSFENPYPIPHANDAAAAALPPQPTIQAPPPSLVSSLRAPAHMCVVPCVIGDNVCVEMMVDTGAQSSVISKPLIEKLGISSRLDRSERGIAAGVGRAAILGKIRNVLCEFGHVEFPIDFIVLDVPDSILLLGLDQMRKYKCIVDLENDKLIFGGHGGVDVPFLPPNQQHQMHNSHLTPGNPFAGNCPIS